MDVYVAGLKGWIEDLSAKNKSLEKEIETLKNTSTNSMKQMEQEKELLKLLEKENNQLKQQNGALKLMEQENSHLKQENGSLKSLEQENNQLKQQNGALKLLENEFNRLKQQNESLKSLEQENVQLKQRNQSLEFLEQENNRLKHQIQSLQSLEQEEFIQLNQQNDSLELLKQESDQLKVENESLNLKISELRNGHEIINVLSDSEYEVNEQGTRKRQKVGQKTGTSSEIAHPLDNQLMSEDEQVLSIFMNYVAPRDLRACRLVCKMWNVEATKQMKMRCTFGLDFCEVKKFLETAPTKFSGFRNLVVDIKRLNVLPNINFATLFRVHGKSLHSVGVEFGNCMGFGMYEFRDLFLASLQHIKYLRLQGLPCVLLHDRKIFSHGYQVQVLANLTEINIALQGNCYRPHHNTQVLADLLRITPNLKSFQWTETQSVPGHNAYATEMMIEALIKINPSKLEALFLHSKVDPAVVTHLTNSPLKLKRLYFSELNGFKVDLVAPCTGRKTELTPLREKYSQHPGEKLKKGIEKKLAYCEQALCVELLEVFLSLPVVKLAGLTG